MAEEKKHYGRNEIISILPQQPPFMFIDEADISKSEALGKYEIKGDEFFLKGHFKDNPVMPGSIMLEALGQLAVLMFLETTPKTEEGSPDKNLIFFTSADGIRCSRICKPGEVLEMRVVPVTIRYPIAVFEGKVSVGGQRAVYAEKISLTFDLVK